MFLVGLMSWWYGSGFLETLVRMRYLIAGTYDFFSIDILLQTLFVPFRQISAPDSNSWLSKFIDRLISRGVGFFVRSMMILVGLATLVGATLYSVCVLVFWLLLPLVPIAAAICFAMGVTLV